jgi:hypothetical protein
MPARRRRRDISDFRCVGLPAERLESSGERWREVEFFEGRHGGLSGGQVCCTPDEAKAVRQALQGD